MGRHGELFGGKNVVQEREEDRVKRAMKISL